MRRSRSMRAASPAVAVAALLVALATACGASDDTAPAVEPPPAPATVAGEPVAEPPPFSMVAIANPRTIGVDGSTTVFVAVIDAAGAPLEGATIAAQAEEGGFEPDGFEFVLGRSDADGQFRVTWRLSIAAPDAQGVRLLRVTVAYRGHSVTADLSITVAGGDGELRLPEGVRLAVAPSEALTAMPAGEVARWRAAGCDVRAIFVPLRGELVRIDSETVEATASGASSVTIEGGAPYWVLCGE